MVSQYIYLDRLISQEYVERKLTKSLLDEHKELPLMGRIKENFRKDVWTFRFDYYIKYAFVRR